MAAAAGAAFWLPLLGLVARCSGSRPPPGLGQHLQAQLRAQSPRSSSTAHVEVDFDLRGAAAGNHTAAATPPAGPARRPARNAFVMMAFDPPGGQPRSLWNVLAMADVIRSVSRYPLVLLTNTTHWPDGTDVASSFAKLGARVLPVVDVPVPSAVLHEYRDMPCQYENPPVCAHQFLKLQIWRLQEYDKLIWMDNDAVLSRGVDRLFHKEGTWAQQDNWDCGQPVNFVLRWSPTLLKAVDWITQRLHSETLANPSVQSTGVCSGMLVFRPSESTYQGLVSYLGGKSSVPLGDQQVIAEYFDRVQQKPVQLLGSEDASFGQCIGKVPAPGGLPAFVHKSDWSNSCFRKDADPIACSGHPLGPYWRFHFCSAAKAAGVSGTHVTKACHRDEQEQAAAEAAAASGGMRIPSLA